MSFSPSHKTNPFPPDKRKGVARKMTDNAITTTTSKAAEWVKTAKLGGHTGRFFDTPTPEDIAATRAALANTNIKGHAMKTPHIPLYYTRDENGHWTADMPLTGDAKQRGTMKARAELATRKLNLVERLRAKLAAKKAGEE